MTSVQPSFMAQPTPSSEGHGFVVTADFATGDTARIGAKKKKQQGDAATTLTATGAGDSGDANSQKKIHIWASRFKTKSCEKFTTTGECTFGFRCMFAHGEGDFRSKEMNFRDGLINEEAILHFQKAQWAQEAGDLRHGGGGVPPPFGAASNNNGSVLVNVMPPPPPGYIGVDGAPPPPPAYNPVQGQSQPAPQPAQHLPAGPGQVYYQLVPAGTSFPPGPVLAGPAGPLAQPLAHVPRKSNKKKEKKENSASPTGPMISSSDPNKPPPPAFTTLAPQLPSYSTRTSPSSVVAVNNSSGEEGKTSEAEGSNYPSHSLKATAIPFSPSQAADSFSSSEVCSTVASGAVKSTKGKHTPSVSAKPFVPGAPNAETVRTAAQQLAGAAFPQKSSKQSTYTLLNEHQQAPIQQHRRQVFYQQQPQTSSAPLPAPPAFHTGQMTSYTTTTTGAALAGMNLPPQAMVQTVTYVTLPPGVAAPAEGIQQPQQPQLVTVLPPSTCEETPSPGTVKSSSKTVPEFSLHSSYGNSDSSASLNGGGAGAGLSSTTANWTLDHLLPGGAPSLLPGSGASGLDAAAQAGDDQRLASILNSLHFDETDEDY